jgi:hypothetical protein
MTSLLVIITGVKVVKKYGVNQKIKMGKIILEFDSIEEKEDARDALDGPRWKLVVWDLDQKLREITKYGYVDKKEATDQERDLADRLRKELREILADYNLNLE